MIEHIVIIISVISSFVLLFGVAYWNIGKQRKKMFKHFIEWIL